MKFSTLIATLAAAVIPAVSAAPLAEPSPDQSPNLDALAARQVAIWVWACDSDNFQGNCGAVKNVNLNTCYAWASLFPGIGNGSFKTNGNVFFHDGNNCTGTASNRVCNTEVSRGNYWYAHTRTISVFSTMAACNH